MTDISIRKHIRWLPGEASEPTSTVVLTSPDRRFVDLRIRLGEQLSLEGKQPLSALDWAIAGTSSSVPLEGDVSHSQWNHWIDSRALDTTNVADEGDMYPQPDGSTLEKGHMINPETGVDTQYEELWVSEEIQAVPVLVAGDGNSDAPLCVVLEMQRDEVKRRGMIVRLGQYCQAFVRAGDGEADITIERLKWDSDVRKWTTLVRIGEAELPTDFATHLAYEAVKDDVVRVGEDVWTVVEKALV